ncbi:MAG: hypothetical protein JRE57_15105 [Deltaproteobacteria bacterium]|nr:hypothetical protein [Deltaproteobacteria bacterium]
MSAGREAFELLGISHSAIDRHAVRPHVFAQGFDFECDLVGEFAGRAHHEGLAGGDRSVEARDDRYPEGPGLAAAGMRLDDQVSAFGHRGQHLFLHGCGFAPTEVANPVLNGLWLAGKNVGEVCHVRARLSRFTGWSPC